MNRNIELITPRLDLFPFTKTTLQLGILCTFFLLLYAPLLAGLPRMWQQHDRLEGYLIPLICLYLIWLDRGKLQQLPLKPAISWGLFLVLSAGILLVLGEVAAVVVLKEASLLMMIMGLILLLLGKVFFKALTIPIAYLFFMLSIIGDVVAPLHSPFQLMTAKMGVLLLQQLGFAALLEQQYIVLPNITLEVARVCSGINYLIAIVAIGLPLAHLTLRSWWRRVILLVLAVAIGIVANWIRVVLIAVWSMWGGQVLHGPFHIFQGMFVAWVGFIALFIGAWGLSRFDKPVSASQKHEPLPIMPPGRQESCSRAEWNRSWWMAMVVLIVFAVYLLGYDRAPVESKLNLATFPVSIGEWEGEQANLQKAIVRVPGADYELVRTYRNRRGQQIHLYVAYLKSQRQGKEIVGERTALLHQDTDEVKIQVAPERFLSVNRTRSREVQQARSILFWYDVNDRVIANRYRAKAATIVGALLFGRTNGALVLIAGGGDGEENHQSEEAFVKELFPVLRSYLP